jgi:hypothetical protein
LLGLYYFPQPHIEFSKRIGCAPSELG